LPTLTTLACIQQQQQQQRRRPRHAAACGGLQLATRKTCVSGSRQLRVAVLLDERYAADYPAPDRLGDGVLFSIDFFVYIFVSLLASLRGIGWTDLHEIFREGVE